MKLSTYIYQLKCYIDIDGFNHANSIEVSFGKSISKIFLRSKNKDLRYNESCQHFIPKQAKIDAVSILVFTVFKTKRLQMLKHILYRIGETCVKLKHKYNFFACS
jgi:hypothetical protein